MAAAYGQRPTAGAVRLSTSPFQSPPKQWKRGLRDRDSGVRYGHVGGRWDNCSHCFLDLFAIGASEDRPDAQGAIKDKLPIEMLTNVITHLYATPDHASRRASEAPVSARAAAVILPAPIIIVLPRSFAPCLANSGCTLIRSNLPEPRFLNRG